MKRSTLLILVLVLSLAMVLVGCGKEEAKQTDPAGETTGNAQTEDTAQETAGDPTAQTTEAVVDTNPEGDPGIGTGDEDDPGVDIYLPGGGNNTGTNERPTDGEGSGEGQPPVVTTPSTPEEDNGEDDFQVDFGDLLG